MAIRIFDAGDNGTTFGGRLIIERQFVNHATREYIHLEAHEVGNGWAHGLDRKSGEFVVAIWCNGDNVGGSDFDGDIRHVVKMMQEYVPDDGFMEEAIPDEYFV